MDTLTVLAPNHPHPKKPMYGTRVLGLPPSAYISFAIAVTASGIYAITQHSIKRELQIKELEKQQVTSNMQLLKSQLSPHFLFNAMNSLYSLSLKKSEKLPEAILTVSDLLRYVTYDSNENFVNIQKEIDYLNNYIALQKLRLSADSQIVFDIQNNNPNVQIAPMIIVPFFENAFKHSVDANGVARINAQLITTKSHIEFHIENSKQKEKQKDMTHGIGIQNVKSRLRLIYGSKHTLDIEDGEEKYVVLLKIKL